MNNNKITNKNQGNNKNLNFHNEKKYTGSFFKRTKLSVIVETYRSDEEILTWTLKK